MEALCENEMLPIFMVGKCQDTPISLLFTHVEQENWEAVMNLWMVATMVTMTQAAVLEHSFV